MDSIAFVEPNDDELLELRILAPRDDSNEISDEPLALTPREDSNGLTRLLVPLLVPRLLVNGDD